MSTGAGVLGGGSAARWVVALDGLDLVVLGAVTPVLLEYEPWGLTPPRVGAITSYGLIGMMIGTLTEVLGRRKAILLSVLGSSAFTALCTLAPSPAVFGALRSLAGFVGLVPTAVALVSEYALPGSCRAPRSRPRGGRRCAPRRLRGDALRPASRSGDRRIGPAILHPSRRGHGRGGRRPERRPAWAADSRRDGRCARR